MIVLLKRYLTAIIILDPMRSATIIFFSLVILSAILFGSCTKSKNTPSVSSMLIGKWKLSSKGYDINKNSLIDPNEDIAVPDSAFDYTVFDSHGSGVWLTTQNGISDTLTWFTWSLTADNTGLTTIRTKGSPGYISLSDTTTYHIDTLSAASLRLTIVAASSGLNWQNYKKQ